MFIKHGFFRFLSFFIGIFSIFSVFFYTPVQVHAQTLGYFEPEVFEDESKFPDVVGRSVSSSPGATAARYVGNVSMTEPSQFDFSSYMTQGSGIYVVEFDISTTFQSSTTNGLSCYMRNMNCYLNNSDLYQQLSASSSGSSGVNSYSFAAHRKFYVNSNTPTMRISYKATYLYTQPPGTITATASYSISNVTCTLLETGDSSDYQDGYNAGYASGQTSGYNSGYSNGYNSGYTAGQDSVDTDSYYQDGFQDGQNSVDTDSFYDDGYSAGYNAGKNSVDTNSYYNAGYDAGYAAAYDLGYDNGYDEAYDVGYATALNDLQKGGSLQGTTKKYTTSLSTSKSSLKIQDVNTLLPVTYEAWEDFEHLYYGVTNGSGEGYLFFDDVDGVLVTGEFSYFPSDSLIKNSDYSQSGHVGFGYYLAGRKSLFVASTDAFAYKVTVKQSNTSYSSNNVMWARCVVGTESDLLVDGGNMGFTFSNGGSSGYTFFVETKNLPVTVASGVLLYFVDSLDFYGDDTKVASFNLSSTLSVEYTPYTRSEYGQIVNSINDVGNKVDKLGSDLMNGYDSSAGSATNTQLKGSVDSYGSMENTLFDSVSGGLSDYEFFDFSSVPAMITGLSFIGSIFLSWFNAAGGASGVGIVLSVLFSVMLVSMALGLYRHYQSRGKKGG